MKKTIWIFVIALLVGAALLAAYLWQQGENLPKGTNGMAPTAVPEAPATSAEPAILHPVEPIVAEEPLPEIEKSDPVFADSLAALVGKGAWQSVFVPDQVIRRIVATVDNLPRSQAPVKMWPVKPAPSWLKTSGADQTLRLDPANAQRYARYVKLVQAVPADQLGQIYRKFYPLFQQAYVELGYPKGYFNDRLVVTIDDLLAAPELSEPPQLVQKKVLYQFADPDLESRSAGQKIMLRIGTENARIVKSKLRQLREVVTTPAPAS